MLGLYTGGNRAEKLLTGAKLRVKRELLFGLLEQEKPSPFPNFGNGNGNVKLHSKLLGTGMGMGILIPDIWKREWKLAALSTLSRCYSLEWPGMGITFKIQFNLEFCP